MTALHEDRFRGSLLGLALGDAVGAPYEGNFAARLVWKALGVRKGKRLRYTDDTQMALLLSESLSARGRLEANDVAGRWALECSWSRGYGQGARALLQRLRRGVPWQEANRQVFPDGSYGNGAAMRAAPLGLFFTPDRARIVEAARLASSITHAHPLGMEGGVLIAWATALALQNAFSWDALAAVVEEDEFQQRIDIARSLGDASPAETGKRLGNSILAAESAVTAVYLYDRMRERTFEELLELVVEVGGDTDTIGAMAGGIWGAERGLDALPTDLLDHLEDRERIDEAARALYRARVRIPPRPG